MPGENEGYLVYYLMDGDDYRSATFEPITVYTGEESEIYMPKAYHDYIKQLKSKQAAISADCRRTP